MASSVEIPRTVLRVKELLVNNMAPIKKITDIVFYIFSTEVKLLEHLAFQIPII